MSDEMNVCEARPVIVFTIVGLLLVASSDWALAQAHARYNGIYWDNGGGKLLVEGVPVNNGEAITAILNGKEITAFRRNRKGPFVYSNSGCTVRLAPQTANRRLEFAVESAGSCIGSNAPLSRLLVLYVRR